MNVNGIGAAGYPAGQASPAFRRIGKSGRERKKNGGYLRTSVSGIGNGAAKEYSVLYNNQAAASRHRAGEVKAPAKADSVVKTRQREQAVPVYAERLNNTKSP